MDIITSLTNKGINFTDQQTEVIHHTDGPALVLAVPGAGKTTTMIARTANLILEGHALADEILSITFTKASAIDMMDRYQMLFEDAGIDVAKFSTIHGFCFQVIGDYGRRKKHYFHVIEGKGYNGVTKASLLGAIYKELTHAFLQDNQIEIVTTAYSNLKNRMADEEDVREMAKKLEKEERILKFADLYFRYEEAKKSNNYLDYDDFLTFTYEILSDNANILSYYQERYKYIQVDEGQDTSLIQHAIISLLGEKYQNVLYVADDDQSIYSFRAAEPDYLLEFDCHYPHAKIFKMETNFRSTQGIVLLANEFIKTNKLRYEKEMITTNGPGLENQILFMDDEKKIIEKIKQDQYYSETALLARDNNTLTLYITKLEKAGIPFYVRNPNSQFFTHWSVEDMFAIYDFARDSSRIDLLEKVYFKLNGFFLSKQNIEDIKRSSSNLSTYDKLRQVVKQRKNIDRLESEMLEIVKAAPEQAIKRILHRLGYMNYLLWRYDDETNLEDTSAYQFIMLLKELAKDTDFFEELRNKMEDLKMTIKESVHNKGKNVVTLSTIHSAKGLEWDTVYLLDVKYPTFPSRKANNRDEERRLCYVGMTRAKSQLIINGEAKKNPEYFMKEIKRVLPRRISKKEYDASISGEDLTVGMNIVHDIFGQGTIVGRDDKYIAVKFASEEYKELSIDFVLQNGGITLTN
jgi:DNA helicase-2/ATP-dependent DNA helicase PcrA